MFIIYECKGKYFLGYNQIFSPLKHLFNTLGINKLMKVKGFCHSNYFEYLCTKNLTTHSKTC